jgi:transposase InsO family protein
LDYPYPSWIRLDLGYSGSVNKSWSFHSSEDNLLGSQARRIVYVPNSMPTWGTKKIVSDRGSQFTSQFWEKLHESMDTKLNFSSAYHSQTDGQTERTNQILEDLLRAYALKYGKSWDKSLPYAEFSYNNSYQASIEMAPYEALHGRQCRTPLF